MGVRDIVIKVIGDTAGVHGSLGALEKRLGTLTASLGNFGPVGKQAAASLEGLASASGLAGAGLVGGVAGGAVLAGAAVTALGLKGLQVYTEMIGRVAEFKRVSGASAEESSRLVQVFQQFGVSSETASGAMFKLSRRATEQAETFRALGIEVAKNSDGSTNLTETLFNVVKAYNSTENAAMKNRIAFAAFGRAGADMIPILAQNDEKLRELARDAHNVFTDQDIASAREYKREQVELGQEFERLSATVGTRLVPAFERALALYNLTLQGKLNENVEDYIAKQHRAAAATADGPRQLRDVRLGE